MLVINNQNFETEGMAHTIMISAAIELGAKNACPRNCAENRQIKHKNQGVGNGNAGHLLRSHTTHHKIIQQAYKLGNAVLHHNGDCHHKRHFVKSLVPNKSFSQTSFHADTSKIS